MKESANSAPSPKRGRGRPRLQPTDLQDSSTVQALERGLVLLQLLAKSGNSTLSDLALQVGLPPSTVHRSLNTLLKHEFVSLEPSSQEWSIGIGAFTVGSSYSSRANLIEASRLELRQLMHATGETANLGIMTNNGLITFLTQTESNHPIRACHLPGTSSPAHSSGIGKALLADLPRKQVETILQKTGLQEFTDKTLITPGTLFDNLALIHQRGWSFDDEERFVGMRCIGAAVHDAKGEPIAGISISGPSARFDAEVTARFGPMVRQTAARITRAIGGLVPNYDSRQIINSTTRNHVSDS